MTTPRTHILTIGLEDYFQVGAFNRFVQKNQWYRFETRLEANTGRTLDLLARHGARATFFVLGWVANRYPALLRTVAEAGHEVGTSGYYHRGLADLTPAEFAADAQRAKTAVEQAVGRRVVGYRLSDGWLGPDDLWALDVLAEVGFLYDSSIAPMRGRFRDQPFRHHVHPHHLGDRTLWEVPVSTAPVCGLTVPVAGGNYLRQLPGFVSRRAARRWVRATDQPLVSYFHVWELDPEQPRLAVGGWPTRLRHYRNLRGMPAKLAALLAEHRFVPAAEYLAGRAEPGAPTRRWDGPAGLGGATPPPSPTPFSDTGPPPLRRLSADGPRTPVTVVVPVFNEEETLPYLGNTLHRLRAHLHDRYDVRFVLVDDGSGDRTWDGLQARFHGRTGYDLVRHDVNCGVAAALMTGIKRAGTEVVASIDCDCSYDPTELANMIPLLAPGVDLVTASPYHPAGGVRNVPAWRLTLSRGCAWLYRRVLKTRLHTYTSCFRVYRRSSVAGIHLKHHRFLGVAELVGRLDLAGGVIVEHPAVLEVRVLGRSKMKTVRTVLGHLRLLAGLALDRARGRAGKPQRELVIRTVVANQSADNALLIRDHAKRTPKPGLDIRKAVLPAANPSEPARP
jgi:polysaccharide deacetylase family protein (PEP-CTERM system associated)